MKQRTNSVLNAAVREYTRTGQPVSSEQLYSRYRFGIKPAMIRFELQNLSDEGFLYQPHVSAGRLPTDQGLRFYVDRLFAEMSELAPAEKGSADDLESFINFLSVQLDSLSAAFDPDEGRFFHAGLEDLIAGFETESKKEIIGIIRDFEKLSRRLENFCGSLDFESLPRIFIGRESPITDSADLAAGIGCYEKKKTRAVVAVVGPKRMDYRKAISLLK